MTALKTNLGRITQIIGPVIDVTFSPKKLPNIYNSLEITAKDESGNDVKIVAEVQQLLGDNLVRACLLYTSPSPRDQRGSRMPSSA